MTTYMTHNVHTTYYTFGGARVGMRQNSEVYWLHGDHLGSASLTTNITGAAVSEMRFYPFGETRWVSGTLPDDILTNPYSTFTSYNNPRYGDVLEVYAPDDRGLRFRLSGEFMGFLEP